MSAVSWTGEEDITVAEVVLKHIRNNSTIKAASEELADKLDRTQGACYSRWTNFLRGKYEAAESIARAKAKKSKELGR